MSVTGTLFNLSTVFDTVAQAVPEQEVLVWRDRRLRYREANERISGVAHYLVSRGLSCRRERNGMRGHESHQNHVGLYMRNGNEYLESMIGAYRSRVVPFNINYRYVAEELHYLLTDAGTRGLIYHAEFAPEVAALREQLPELDILIQVADGSGNALLPGAVDYESIVHTEHPSMPMPEPRGDDLYILYTGGTTGMPKGVVWRQNDIYIRAMGGTPFGTKQPYTSYREIAAAARAANGGVTLLMTAPFMHGAAQWSAFHMITTGGTIVLPDNNVQLDWTDALRVTERERVVSVPVIGDAMARPMVEAVEQGQYDLSGLVAVSNGGAPLTPTVRKRVLEVLPNVLLLDAVGSSETGIQLNHLSVADAEADTAIFHRDDSTTVIDDALTRELSPGEGEGWLATKGLAPLGYLGDEAKTARSFPVINGVRYSVPGDRAVIREDGRVELLGRAGLTVNSGGEKIFVEEVERAVASHPDVRDVVVVGRPSPAWGSEVVALVELDPASDATDADLLAECQRHIARYKMPKAILRLPEVVRSPSGKADYRWAREQALAADPENRAVQPENRAVQPESRAVQP